MSLLAETLVEEWLNRQGFFTIRGVKQGVHEIDLLALRHRASAEPEAWHVESQVSFRPVSYLTPLSPELAAELGKKATSSFRRTEEQMVQCVTSWVAKKFRAPRKQSARQTLWPDVIWRFVVVHGAVKHPEELAILASQEIIVIPLTTALQDLCGSGRPIFTGSAGGDLADLIAFYAQHSRLGA